MNKLLYYTIIWLVYISFVYSVLQPIKSIDKQQNFAIVFPILMNLFIMTTAEFFFTNMINEGVTSSLGRQIKNNKKQLQKKEKSPKVQVTDIFDKVSETCSVSTSNLTNTIKKSNAQSFAVLFSAIFIFIFHIVKNNKEHLTAKNAGNLFMSIIVSLLSIIYVFCIYFFNVSSKIMEDNLYTEDD